MRRNVIFILMASLVVISLAGCRKAEINEVPETASLINETRMGDGSLDILTASKVKELVLNHVHLTEDDVIFTELHLDMESGRRVYDVEFYSGDVEYDYQVDALNGVIMEYEHEQELFTEADFEFR